MGVEMEDGRRGMGRGATGRNIEYSAYIIFPDGWNVGENMTHERERKKCVIGPLLRNGTIN
jgi:hypothetical protein